MTFVPNARTRIFPVLGDPIEQVRSPSEMTRAFQERGINAMVFPAHVAPAGLRAVVEALALIANVGGVLVTIPHKFSAFELCSRVSDRARLAGSINTMLRTADGWAGDNTDGIAHVDGIEKAGFPVERRKALMVGCGGAGSAIAFELLLRGVSHLAIHDVDLARRDALLRRLSERFPGRAGPGAADPAGFDLVVNATPLGMRPTDALPLDTGRLEPQQFVSCVVTRPEVPPLIAQARARGCRTMTGCEMFAAQVDAFLAVLPAASVSQSDVGGDA